MIPIVSKLIKIETLGLFVIQKEILFFFFFIICGNENWRKMISIIWVLYQHYYRTSMKINYVVMCYLIMNYITLYN